MIVRQRNQERNGQSFVVTQRFRPNQLRAVTKDQPSHHAAEAPAESTVLEPKREKGLRQGSSPGSPHAGRLGNGRRQQPRRILVPVVGDLLDANRAFPTSALIIAAFLPPKAQLDPIEQRTTESDHSKFLIGSATTNDLSHPSPPKQRLGHGPSLEPTSSTLKGTQ